MSNDELQKKLKKICQAVLEVDSHIIALEKMAAYDAEHSKQGIDIDVYLHLADTTKKKNWQVYERVAALLCTLSGQEELLDELRNRLAEDWNQE